MALGEYVSVSSQRDSERALVEMEQRELATKPEAELAQLASIYRAKGLSPETADRVARELTEHDALAAHLEVEHGIDQDDLVSPWHAAAASAVAFLLGGVLPLAAILLPDAVRVPVTFAVVLLALALTGAVGARLGGTSAARPALRVVVGGALALGATFALGSLRGTTIG